MNRFLINQILCTICHSALAVSMVDSGGYILQLLQCFDIGFYCTAHTTVGLKTLLCTVKQSISYKSTYCKKLIVLLNHAILYIDKQLLVTKFNYFVWLTVSCFAPSADSVLVLIVLCYFVWTGWHFNSTNKAWKKERLWKTAIF